VTRTAETPWRRKEREGPQQKGEESRNTKVCGKIKR